ncbi:MAG: PIN domain-containing protein [Opitutae bacterium]|nr:PIN domain-containing protein [Opitutae bacterium]
MADFIADTGPIVGWINRHDQWHSWSVATLEDLSPPLLTCEAVIAEAAWLLGSSRESLDRLYGMVEAGALQVVELLPEHVSHIRALSAKYPQMDFCDAAVVRLSEIYPFAKVLTTDRAHFRIYRRLRDKPLPLICPEG